jgi:hypothetical protein
LPGRLRITHIPACIGCGVGPKNDPKQSSVDFNNFRRRGDGSVRARLSPLDSKYLKRTENKCHGRLLLAL